MKRPKPADSRKETKVRTEYSPKTAWKSKPTWFLVAADDRMIPARAQRIMSKRTGGTVTEAKGSHAIYVSQPKTVAELIVTASKGATSN